MSQERLSELKEQLYSLERKLRPLEWDASKNQINEFKRTELGRLKEEWARLSAEMQELEFSQQKALVQPFEAQQLQKSE